MPDVSKAEFARNLGVSKPRVTQYVAAGLPVLHSGKIDLEIGTRWVADNFRPTERNEGKGAERAASIVKQNGKPEPPPNPVTPRRAAAMAVAPLEDVLRPLLLVAGRIAARAAVAAGASMETAYAIEVIASIEMGTAALLQLPPSRRAELEARDWPWSPMELGHHETMDAFWRELSADRWRGARRGEMGRIPGHAAMVAATGERMSARDALAVIDRMEANIAAEIAALRRSFGATESEEAGDDVWPAFADDPDLISTEEAAQRACRGQDAIREWCAKHGIGRTYGGRYRVSVRRLRQHLARSDAQKA